MFVDGRQALKRGLGLLSVAAVLLAGCEKAPTSGVDPRDQTQVRLGTQVYATYCASCHGAKLEGESAWRSRKADGRMPAPPHDATGHTWHHPDEVLFGITKEGLVPGKYAPPGYVSNMPAFGNVLSDDQIRAVLAYIQSTWPEQVWSTRREMLKNRQR